MSSRRRVFVAVVDLDVVELVRTRDQCEQNASRSHFAGYRAGQINPPPAGRRFICDDLPRRATAEGSLRSLSWNQLHRIISVP